MGGFQEGKDLAHGEALPLLLLLVSPLDSLDRRHSPPDIKTPDSCSILLFKRWDTIFARRLC